LEIVYLNSVGSTHIYLQNLIKNNGYKSSLAIYTTNQTNGIGSRNNSWIGKQGNLFLSFVIHKSILPSDLPLQSASIYFSYIFKQVLENLGSKVFVKWPNDFYIDDKKIGGIITNLRGDLFFCGIGLNIINVSDEYGSLDIKVDIEKLIKLYFISLEKYPSWKQIISEFKIEFESSKKYFTHIKNKKISLKRAFLEDDGSLVIDGDKVFSLR
jgi:BirA family biotin operon repressor/biotin-[acetyl-CoA-carboxylase] ligase